MLRSPGRRAVRTACFAAVLGLMSGIGLARPLAARAAPPRVLVQAQGCTSELFPQPGLYWAINGCSDGRFYSNTAIVITYTGKIIPTYGGATYAPPPSRPVVQSLDQVTCDTYFGNHFISHLGPIPGVYPIVWDGGAVAINPAGKIAAGCVAHATSIGPFAP
jgi:hypothetical protein